MHTSSQPDHAAPVPAQQPSRRQYRAQAALWIIGGLLVIALGSALQAMAPVVIPVVFAVLVTLVLAPLHARLVGALTHALRWIAHLTVMTLLLGIILAFLGALVFAAERVLEEMPKVSGSLQSLLPSGHEASALLGGRLQEVWGTLSSSLAGWLVDQITGLAESIAGMTGVFVTTLVVVFFLILLALTERGMWRGKIQSLWPGDGEHAWSQALATLASRLRRFLLVRTAVGLLQAALYVGWLALFDMDLLFVWGVLTFLLTYIPNLGSIVAGTLPVLYALATKDWMTALGVAAGLLVIEQVVGNYLDPRILGRQIRLSPFVILVSLLFWSWLWGIAGAFLATPIMLSCLVAFNQWPPLRPIALVLSDQRTPADLDHALARG